MKTALEIIRETTRHTLRLMGVKESWWLADQNGKLVDPLVKLDTRGCKQAYADGFLVVAKQFESLSQTLYRATELFDVPGEAHP